jgi:hypothetical protein
MTPRLAMALFMVVHASGGDEHPVILSVES